MRVLSIAFFAPNMFISISFFLNDNQIPKLSSESVDKFKFVGKNQYDTRQFHFLEGGSMKLILVHIEKM